MRIRRINFASNNSATSFPDNLQGDNDYLSPKANRTTHLWLNISFLFKNQQLNICIDCSDAYSAQIFNSFFLSQFNNYFPQLTTTTSAKVIFRTNCNKTSSLLNLSIFSVSTFYFSLLEYNEGATGYINIDYDFCINGNYRAVLHRYRLLIMVE